MTRMGAESRRRETESLSQVLARYRPVRWMREPATLEGGDVLRIGSTLYAGHSRRTNVAGLEQLAAELRPLGYAVEAVVVHGCLHLKSACSSLGEETILVNRDWVDISPFQGLHVIDVPREEPNAANVLVIGDTAIIPASFPRTAALVERLGWKVQTLDISELQKAEAALTCSSIILNTAR
jgi:dimethylargininase